MKPHKETMKAHKETYSGCHIELSKEGKLAIDKKAIDYMYDPSVDKYITKYLPYTQYGSVMDLARAIVAVSPDFTGKTE
jgi:hypothetical protein